MRLNLFILLLPLLLGAPGLRADTSVPTQLQPMPSLTLAPGGASVAIDLRTYFGVPGVSGTKFAIFDTVMGRFSVELRDDVAPRHVANFLTYVEAGHYTNSLFHHAPTFPFVRGGPSIIVGGSTRLLTSGLGQSVTTRASVPGEYGLNNERGTLAAARTLEFSLGNDSPFPPTGEATSEWFFNVNDNSAQLRPAARFGYTVFGRVLGTGLTVIDAIAALQTVNLNWLNDPNGLWGSFPVRNDYRWPGPQFSDEDVVTVHSIEAATLFPTGQGRSVVEVSIHNSAPAVVGTKVSASALSLAPIGAGTANITVRVFDVRGSFAETAFNVRVEEGAPIFLAHPVSRTVAGGSTAVFTAPATNGATYRWERNAVPVVGATSSTLVITNASAATAGSYAAIAANNLGSVRSDPASLSVASISADEVGHLTNVSVLTAVGPGSKGLTIGTFVGGGAGVSALPLLVRAVGPTLARPPMNVSNVLADPVMALYSSENSTPIGSNDDWASSIGAGTTSRFVGAFELPTSSLDSAIAHVTPGVFPGAYTLQVSGKNGTSGKVLVEVYDASGALRTDSTPRLRNLSVRAQVDPASSLVLGFVVAGQSARTMLVRAVGPSLAPLGVNEFLADPKLEIVQTATGRVVATNDDWAGREESVRAAAAVGAFAFVSGTSTDAVLLLTVSPGSYSARVTGVGGTTGVAMVEIYDVP